MVLQAPDVAYSELAVNMVALPFLFLVTLAAARINQRRRQAEEQMSALRTASLRRFCA